MQQPGTWCKGEAQQGPQAHLADLGRPSTVIIAALAALPYLLAARSTSPDKDKGMVVH